MKQKRTRHVLRLTAIVLLILCGVGALLFNGYRRYVRTEYPLDYTELIEKYSAEYDINPSLICAVICVESHYKSEAVSHAGAVGLMQLTPDTFNWAQQRAGIKEKQDAKALTDPETNIRFGTYTLRLLYEQFEDEDAVLAAYNAGQGNVRRWLSDSRYSDDGVHLKAISYAETETYVRRIEKAQSVYQKLYHIR